jgi:hypothetical protein
MYHYCKTCQKNNHCEKCCSKLKDYLREEKCPVCREKGHVSKDCCLARGGALYHLEKRYKEKELLKFKKSKYDDDDDHIMFEEEIDPNVVLYMQQQEAAE